MAIRIVGVDLPQNKHGEIALTYIFGIGRSSQLCKNHFGESRRREKHESKRLD